MCLPPVSQAPGSPAVLRNRARHIGDVHAVPDFFIVTQRIDGLPMKGR
jgi:hypothetical protein